MKATSSVDVVEEAPSSTLVVDADILDTSDLLKQNTSLIGEPLFSSSPMNDAASAGDTASVSSASVSMSASVSAVDSMDPPGLPGLPNGVVETPPPNPSRPMRRCVSDVGLEPNVPVFPSLPDSYLEQLGLVFDLKTGNETSTDQDIENKFVAVSLAMKTDRLTLDARFHKQKKLWEQSIRNVEQEATNLNAALHRLSYLCTDSESVDILTNIKEQVSFLLRAVDYVSGNAETLGAVRQEARVSRAWDVAVSHLENVKLLLDNAKTDLDESRRMLTDQKQRPGSADSEPVTPSRSRSVAAVERPGSKRRASIATIARPLTPSGLHGTPARGFLDGSARTRSALRMVPYFPRTSTCESGLSSVETSELAENPTSPAGECGQESGSNRDELAPADKMEENNNSQTEQDKDIDTFLKAEEEDDDAFLLGDEQDVVDELPDEGLPVELLDQPITLFRCQETNPTVRWLKEHLWDPWTMLDSLLDNLQRPDMEQVMTSGRKLVVGLLLAAAAACILQIFVPVGGTHFPA